MKSTSSAFTLVIVLLLINVAIAHKTCRTADPTELHHRHAQEAEIHLFGKTVDEMDHSEYSDIVQSMHNRRQLLVDPSPTSYQLVKVPIVYHVLSKQNSGSALSPSLNEQQQIFSTEITNQLYNIYDRNTKLSVQFMTFTNETIVHDDLIINKDCSQLNYQDYQNIVTKANEWQYKLHAIVCEIRSFSGQGNFPSNFPITDPRHNAIITDHRTYACYDQNNNFICDKTNGQNISKARWWVSESKVLAHEFGHTFGLFHTFQGGCLNILGGDGVSDTPPERNVGSNDCPGLIPFDKDRDLFNEAIRRIPNTYADPSQCSYHGQGVRNCSSNTCGACCDKQGRFRKCPKFRNGESISEDQLDIVCCPNESRPADSCPLRHGIDPKTNVMAYSPDYCIFELTPGQMVRMMAQIRSYKDYIYCNYVNFVDSAKCTNVPCASTATSPNCI